MRTTWMRCRTVIALLALMLLTASFHPSQTLAENPVLTVVVTNDAPGGEAEYGSTVNFTYTVTNSGDETVTAITVTDGWAGHVGDIAALAPGASKSFSSAVVVEGSIGGSGSCTAEGTGAQEVRVSATGTYMLEVFIADAFTDFAIGKRLVSGTAVPGGRLTYRLTITNVDGAEPDPDASTIRVVDDFPESGMRVVDAGGGTISAGTLLWNVSAPSGDAPVVIEYVLEVSEDARGTLVNGATIWNPLDPDESNDAASASVTVATPAAPDADGDDAGSAPTVEPASSSGVASSPGDAAEPFLPFTGAPLFPLLPLAALFTVVGGTLRRLGA